jgi:hypothetical protein
MTSLGNYLYNLEFAKRWASSKATDTDIRKGGVERMVNDYMNNTKKTKKSIDIKNKDKQNY